MKIERMRKHRTKEVEYMCVCVLCMQLHDMDAAMLNALATQPNERVLWKVVIPPKFALMQ